jgi:hypothetical protein
VTERNERPQPGRHIEDKQQGIDATDLPSSVSAYIAKQCLDGTSHASILNGYL